jgi:uncharacterized protein (DUF1501 family)
MINRRRFITQAGLGTISACSSILGYQWLAYSANPSSQSKRLVVIFLRGAVDGLNVVVPYQEPDYYRYRSSIAIPKPGQPNGALDLDGRFGLHPALAPILPLWQQKSLAFIHASGLPAVDRSHFDAQFFMERGAGNSTRSGDGWLNRLLAVMNNKAPLQAVSLSSNVPQILNGKMPVSSISGGRLASRRRASDRKEVSTAFDQLYGNNRIGRVYREGQAARQQLLKDYETEMNIANNGAKPPTGFAADATSLGRLMARDERIQIAFLQLGGWDTHINQGGSQGALARNLGNLASGLIALQQSLGNAYQNTEIVVMSEFGRTARENGNKGTDHGYGNVMWLLGGRVAGGQVYGKWPGLAENQLFQGRDLAVTTDYREPIGQVLQTHLGLNSSSLAKVFPGFVSKNEIKLHA